MKMTYRVLLLLMLPAVCSFSQPIKELYRETVELGDTALQMKILSGWEEMRPSDPEMCLAQAERYFKKSRHKKAKPDSLPYFGIRATLLDDTSPRSQPRYYPVKVSYEPELFMKAVDYLTRGIIANPDHIDLRMMKISFLHAFRSPAATQEILDLLKQAKINNNTWFVQDSVPWDAHDTLLPYLQRTIRQMYTTGIASHEDVRKIATAILDLYPEHHQSLVDVGRSYYLSHDFTTALKYLLHAEEVMPHNLQAIGYIALCYYYLGDPANAVKYFDKLKEFGDEDDRKFADDRIQEIANK